MTIQTHCPHCRRLLSIPELIDMWCEPCLKPTNVLPQPAKRAA